MNYVCIFTAMAGVLLASSCEKINSLTQEKAASDAEFQQISVELQSLDVQFSTLDAHASDNIPPEQQHAEWEKKNAALKQSLAELSKKCTQGDELLKKVHSKLDAYKALNSQ